jgi:hypothetical protein
MKKKYLIWFNSQIKVDEENLQDWNILAMPDADTFWSDAVKEFDSATVVFLIVENNERGRIIPAAHAVLGVTSDVRLIRISEESVITSAVLENAAKIPEALLDIDEEDLASLTEVEAVPQLHPAQDYLDSTFYYGTKIHGKDYLITSAQEMIPLIACPGRGISLIEPQLSMVGFSHSRVLDYFSGAEDETPNALHDDILTYIKRHFYFPTPEMYDLIAVWIMGTYIFRAFRYFPYLHLNAEKGSGKTLLMELMSPIAFNGVHMSQPSAVTVLKLIAQDSATLFIDEAEGLGEIRSATSQLKNILKTGFARSGVYYSGDAMYRTYSPKCFAGINMLDDVLADRTITVRLIRKTGHDTTELYRETPLMRKSQSELRDRFYLFGLKYGVGIAEDYNSESNLYDKLPHLSNRAYDVWVPLFKIVNAFSDGDDKTRVFNSLDVLSQADARRRVIRDAEENETGLALAMLDDVLPHVLPLETKDDMKYYDPDVIYESLHRLDLLPKSMEKKGLSRMLKRTLDIDSIPRSFGSGTKRMYAISSTELESYRRRYADVAVE